MIAPPDVVAQIKKLQDRTWQGHAHGKKYLAQCSSYCAGRAVKLVAHELGGPDYISLNLYDLAKGAQLFPCEMPHDKVLDFVRAFRPQESVQGD